MAGKITRKKKVNNFVMLDKTCLLDRNISFKAKGLHSYLMQLPDDWNVNISDLTNRSKDGRDSVTTAMNELIKAGYVSRELSQSDKGLLAGYDYIMYECPQTVSGLSVYGKSVNGLSVNGKSNTNKDYTDKGLINEILIKDSENAQSDFPNPSNPFLTLKEEEKKKKVAPAPGAAKAKKTRTGREDHTWSETLAHLQDNDPAMYMWAQQAVKIWDDWMEYRIENKKCTPYGSAKTEAIAVKQLHKLAEGKESNARAIVEYVRANGYQGLYLPPELKQQPGQSGYKRQEKQGVNPYNYG